MVRKKLEALNLAVVELMNGAASKTDVQDRLAAAQAAGTTIRDFLKAYALARAGLLRELLADDE